MNESQVACLTNSVLWPQKIG